MPFIGNKPSAVPLTSADIADSIITSAKIVDGTIVNADINASAAIVNSKLSGVGITQADQWRLTADKTGNSDITANLERSDNTAFGYIGTGMTQSSGIFTFPSTGIYLITAQGYWLRAGSAYSYAGIIVNFTVNNSTYIAQGRTYVSGASSAYANSFINCLVDVTDVSNCKIKFYADSDSATLGGDTDSIRTGFTFIRLGDT
jgi:hypothetical protein